MASASNRALPKAYIIGGHGAEGSDDFEVPDGCIIVVKAYSGSLMQGYTFLKQELCSLSPDILKDPINHYADLYKAFGPLAIYKPGQKCPNFSYTLLSCYKHNSEWNGCDSFGSGTIDVDSLYIDKIQRECIRHISKSTRRNKNYNEYRKLSTKRIDSSTYAYMKQLYKHSVFPTSERIGDLMDDLSDEGANTLSDMLSGINVNVHHTQKDLCELFPGVYYNFVCRASQIGKQLFEYNENRESYHIPSDISFHKDTYKKTLQDAEAKLEEKIYQYFNKEQINPNDKSLPQMDKNIKELEMYIAHLKNKPSTISNLLGKHIGEAEAHRKEHIKRMYNKQYAATAAKGGKSYSVRRTRRKRNISQRKNSTRV